MNLTELLSLALFTIFAENFVLVHFLGVDSFLVLSRKTDVTLSMGLIVTAVMGLTSLCTWLINTYLLGSFAPEGFLQALVFIPVIAALTALTALLLKKSAPSLYATLDSHFPLITTNCAVLGVALLNAQAGCGVLASIARGVFGGLGFTLAGLLFASVCERLEFAECPNAFKGAPIALVTAGLLAMAFMGFSGLSLPLV